MPTHRSALAFAALFAGALHLGSQQPGRTTLLRISEFKLANGLTVVVNEDHSTPVVGVDVWYHIGSADEHDRQRGFAHACEHLSDFRPELKTGTITGFYRAIGAVSAGLGSSWAATTPDDTRY